MINREYDSINEAYKQVVNEGNPNRPIPDVVGGIATGDYSPRNILGHLADNEIEYLKAVASGEANLYDNPDLEEKMYEFFAEEMPYGVQKARTGDPEEWFANRLHQLFAKETKMSEAADDFDHFTSQQQSDEFIPPEFQEDIRGQIDQEEEQEEAVKERLSYLVNYINSELKDSDSDKTAIELLRDLRSEAEEIDLRWGSGYED